MEANNRLEEWRKTMNAKELQSISSELILSEEEEVKNLPQKGRGRVKKKAQPIVILPDGRVEAQDPGTTLGDLLRYYPNYYLLENYLSSRPIPHRSAGYLLLDDAAYKLVKDDNSWDIQSEFMQLNEKLESVAQENMELKQQLKEVLQLTIQMRKDQMIVRQNVSNKCRVCNESLKFRIIKTCKLCLEEYCSICVVKVSFPMGFRKGNTFHSSATICCIVCLPNLFYMRNHPPLDQIDHVNTVMMEKYVTTKADGGQTSTQSNANAQGNSTLPRKFKLKLRKPTEREIVQSSAPSLAITNNNNNAPSTIVLTSSATLTHPAADFENCTGAYYFNFTYYTAGDSKISLPLKFLDPLCKLTFWYSGVGENMKFDRKTIDRATGTRYAASNSAHEVRLVEVPRLWPDLLSPAECARGLVAPLPQGDGQRIHHMQLLIFIPTKINGPWPAVIFFHGGGFCVGRPTDQIYENACTKIANDTGSVVVSVDYRLAPESKFPTQIEDAYSAVMWVYENADTLKVDRNKIIVCGDSAGGTLAAVSCLLARDRAGPKITHQILVYPCLLNPIDDSLESHRRYVDGPILSKKLLKWFLTQLFKSDNLKNEMEHPYASPLLADLHNLPPTTIINAFHDPLRDHGELYAEKLRSVGVPVTRTVYRKSTHGFFGAPTKESEECLLEVCYAIRVAFGMVEIDPAALDRLYRRRLALDD